MVLKVAADLIARSAIEKLTPSYFPMTYGGRAGEAGFSMCLPDSLPDGFLALTNASDPTSDNFGNIQYADGSVMGVIANMFYRIGHPENPTYGDYGANSIDMKFPHDFAETPAEAFPGLAAAQAEGYACHRMFYVGGEILPYYARDKYFVSKNAWGAGFIPSSIKNGAPITCSADHNPITELTAISSTAYYNAVDAVKARDGVDGAINPASIFHVETRFIQSYLWLCELAHRQAAVSAANCAWYDIGRPAHCDNNALGSVDHADVSYTSDGYSNCCLAGSGLPYAKTTHNGQACGLETGGTVWAVQLGLTRSIENDAWYTLKTSVDPVDLTSGENGAMGAWGNNAHLTTLYDAIAIDHIPNASAWVRFGNADNAIFDNATEGAGWALTGLGLPKDANSTSASGTTLAGNDGVYQYHRDRLCVRSGGYWGSGSIAGAGCASLPDARGYSNYGVGFRAACALRT